MPTTRIPYGVLDGRYVNSQGDTMLGELTLAGAPTSDLHASTKKYVDDGLALKAADADVLKKDGSVALTTDWDIGDNRKILADGIRARDAAGLELYDGDGNGIFIEDGGQVGIGTNQPPAPLTIKAPNGTVSEGATFPFRCICGEGENAGMIFERSDASKFISLFTGGGAAIAFTNDATKLSIGTNTYANRFSTGWPTTEILALYPGGDVNVASGNLGIGIESPGSKLHVYKAITHSYPTPGQTKGSIHVAPNTVTDDDSVSITFGAGPGGQANNAQAGLYVQYSSVYGTRMYFGTSDNFGYGSQARMMIDPAGNVGIGTTGPDRRLDVLDASDPQLRLTHTDGSVYTDFQTVSDGYLYINPSGSRVGIGTNSPSSALHIQGNIASGYVEPVVENVSATNAAAGFAFKIPSKEWKLGVNMYSDFRVRDETLGRNVFTIKTGTQDNAITIDGNGMIIAQKLEINGAFDHDGSTLGVFGVAPASRVAAYTVNNALEDRSFDADNTTIAELADVVATIIDDLKTYGFFQ